MIKVLLVDLRQALEEALGRKPTKEEVKNFEDYVSPDVHDWLKDNAKAFVRNE